MPGVNDSLTVVVIGRNEGERLRRCLQSVMQAQAGTKDWKLVYVDSGSRDGSVVMARQLGWDVVELATRRPTAALARNAGWRSSDSKWILFLDGDTVLHLDFVRSAIDTAQADEMIASVWGHRREMDPVANVYHRVLDLDWVYRPGVSEFCGGDALFRRSALAAVGGFDESLIAGEEPELCSRLRGTGHMILHIDHPMTMHDLAIRRLPQYWKRTSRAGYAYAQMAWRTRGRNVRLWASESRANLLRCAALIGLFCVPLLAPQLSLLSISALAALCLRSAYRARWKSKDSWSLLLYGIHSHLQQIPIASGQFAFLWDLMRNRRRMLIEYK
jgi:glycosyltransferase involved in cell wall biosynthesis